MKRLKELEAKRKGEKGDAAPQPVAAIVQAREVTTDDKDEAPHSKTAWAVLPAAMKAGCAPVVEGSQLDIDTSNLIDNKDDDNDEQRALDYICDMQQQPALEHATQMRTDTKQKMPPMPKQTVTKADTCDS